jgi:hypothetical protein
MGTMSNHGTHGYADDEMIEYGGHEPPKTSQFAFSPPKFPKLQEAKKIYKKFLNRDAEKLQSCFNDSLEFVLDAIKNDGATSVNESLDSLLEQGILLEKFKELYEKSGFKVERRTINAEEVFVISGWVD